MIGRLLERLIVQVRADTSLLAKDLHRGLAQTSQMTGQMAKKWGSLGASTTASINKMNTAFKKGSITQADYMRGLHKQIAVLKSTGMAHREAQKDVMSYAASLRLADGGLGRTGARTLPAFTRSMGQARMQVVNMGYQLNDIGMTLATGMNPMTVLIQQGSQLLQIYAGQGGVKAAFQDFSKIIVGIGRRVWPLAILAGMFKTLSNRIDDTTSHSITFGDTTKAVFQVLGRRIMSVMGPPLDWLMDKFSTVWSWVVDGAVWMGNKVINSVRVMIHAVPIILSAIPSMFNAAFTRALAEVSYAMADIIQSVSTTVGHVSTLLNETFGTSMTSDPLSEAYTYFNRRGNDLIVSAGAIADGIRDEWEAGMEGANDIWNSDPMGNLFKDIRDQSIKNSIARLAEESTEAASELADAIRDRMKDAADGFGQIFADTFMEIRRDGEFSFRSLAQKFEEVFAQATAKMIQQQMANVFTSLIGGLGGQGSGLGNFLTTVFSGGQAMPTAAGIRGRAVGGVEMPWSSFVAGERGTELISQDGPSGARRIMTAGRTSREMGGGSDVNVMTKVNLNIQNHSKENVTAQQKPSFDGSGDMIEIVIGAVKADMGAGGFDKTMMSRFNVSKTKTRR